MQDVIGVVMPPSATIGFVILVAALIITFVEIPFSMSKWMKLMCARVSGKKIDVSQIFQRFPEMVEYLRQRKEQGDFEGMWLFPFKDYRRPYIDGKFILWQYIGEFRFGRDFHKINERELFMIYAVMFGLDKKKD